MKRLLLLAVALSCAITHAQVTVAPILQPHNTFVDQSGAPCSGCSLFSYTAGTTIAQATYTDASGGVQNTNPIVLSVQGGANVWVNANVAYKFVLKNTLGATIWTVDYVTSPAATGGDIVSNPSGSQTITQLSGTSLNINTSGGGKLKYNGNEVLSTGTGVQLNPPSGVTQNVVETGGATFNYNGSEILTKAHSGTLTTLGLDMPATGYGHSVTDFTFIGDSITICYISGVLCPPEDSYSNIIQQGMNRRVGGIGQGGYMSGPQMGRLTTTGTASIGTHGPLASDLILASGATASFPATFANTLNLTTFNAPGGGTLTVTGVAGAWGSPINTGTGSGETKATIIGSPDGANHPSQTITMSCAGGPCEITNIVAATLPATAQSVGFIQTVAQGGYSTANFLSNAVLDSIAYNRMFVNDSLYSAAVLAIGTNDIYNPPTAVTPAVFKANLQTIITGLKTRGIAPILTVPLKTTPASTYQPVLGTFDDFRNAIYDLASTNNCNIVDLSLLDLADGNLLGSDGLHPTQQGYAALAEYYTKHLDMYQLSAAQTTGKFAYPITSMASSIQAAFYNDANNINRGVTYAINGTSSPVGTWPIGSFVLEGPGPTGDTIVGNFGTGHLKFQTNGRTDQLVFDSLTAAFHLPVSMPSLAIAGGAAIAAPNVIPIVGTPTAGQAACIKAAGPPVVIGFCSTAVSGSGSCTCN